MQWTSEHVEKVLPFWQNEWADLIGATITGIEATSDGGDDYLWPTLVVSTPDGKTLKVEVSMDEEANGPGYLFIKEPDE